MSKTNEPGQSLVSDPFYDLKPERMWIGVTNCIGDGKLHVIAEINGVRKSLWSMKPSYAECDEGVFSDWTNFTWALFPNTRNQPTPPEGER